MGARAGVNPRGAAKTLIRIATKHPEVLHELMEKQTILKRPFHRVLAQIGIEWNQLDSAGVAHASASLSMRRDDVCAWELPDASMRSAIVRLGVRSRS